MWSEHQYAMHYLLIFLLVHLGAPAAEGMVSAPLRFITGVTLIQLLTSSSGVVISCIDQRRSELKEGEGAHRSTKLRIKSLTKATNMPIPRTSAVHSVNTL